MTSHVAIVALKDCCHGRKGSVLAFLGIDVDLSQFIDNDGGTHFDQYGLAKPTQDRPANAYIRLDAVS